MKNHSTSLRQRIWQSLALFLVKREWLVEWIIKRSVGIPCGRQENPLENLQ